MIEGEISIPRKSGLTGKEKAAALLLMMGKDNASRLADHFSQDEISKLVEAANHLPGLDPEMVDQLFDEFGEKYTTQGLSAGTTELSEVLGISEPNSSGSGGKKPDQVGNQDNVVPLGPELLIEFFNNEPPMLCAVLMDTLESEVVAKTFADLDSVRRNTIFNSYLNRREISPEVQSFLETEILGSILTVNDDDAGETEKAERAAGLINYLKDEVSDDLLSHIEGSSPELARTIKKSLFKFSSIDTLTKEARAVLFDGVESDDIVAALGDCTDSVKEAVLDVLSQRNRRMVEAELAKAEASTEKVESAQRAIAGLALRLSKDGKLSLPEDDLAE